MKHISTKIAAALLFFTGTTLFAQNVEFDKANFPNDKSGFKDARRNLEDGDVLFNRSFNENANVYDQALELYLKANAFNPNNGLLNYKIGVCYLNSAWKDKALTHLEKAFKLNPHVGTNIHYYLGEAYHLNMMWDKAIQEYQTNRSEISPNDVAAIKNLDKKVAECRNGIELVKNPVLVFIDNVGPEINSSFPDYGPVISADESVLMFTSRRSSSTGGNVVDGMYFEDIYISSGENGKWTVAKNMGKPVNTDGHDAIVGLSPDGQKLFIYLDDKGDGNLYECELKGAAWSKPDKLDNTINTKSSDLTKCHESSASISADGKTLYFASSREGSFGEHDIYKSTWDLKKRKWGEAENLGPTINTSV